MTKYLKPLLKNKKTVLVPGVFNAITAKLAEKLGFKALYLSGAGVSNALLGKPDIGLITRDELLKQVRYIKDVVSVPLIVDVDTGFGEPKDVAETVRQMEKAGASAIQIEDQIPSKKCGHLEGKSLVSIDVMMKKIQAAIKARKSPEFLIIARTDARSVEGVENALIRAQNYICAGADIIFPEALESAKEFRMFSKTIQKPLLANMTEFGKTPYISVPEFQKLGYYLVIFPMTAFRVMMKAAEQVFKDLKKTGSQKKWLSKMQTRKELYDLIDYKNF